MNDPRSTHSRAPRTGCLRGMKRDPIRSRTSQPCPALRPCTIHLCGGAGKLIALLLAATLWMLPPTDGVAAQGGELLWKLRVPGRGETIQAVGDDGVVVIGTVWPPQAVGEIIPKLGETPYLHRLDGPLFVGTPFARVGGFTYLRTQGNGYISWTDGVEPHVITVQSFADLNFDIRLAIGSGGDVFLLFRKVADHRCYLSRWARDGNLVFEIKVGPPESHPQTLVLGVGDTVFLSTADLGLTAFSPGARLLWRADSLSGPFTPTSQGGVIGRDLLNRPVRLSAAGTVEALLDSGYYTPQYGAPLTPSDTLLSVPGLGPVNAAALADGGMVLLGDRSVYRLSSTGVILWQRSWSAFQPVVGNGIVYGAEFVTDERGMEFMEYSAFGLGAPLADSSWPLVAGWPDGSHRGRARSFPPPMLTILRENSKEGAVLDFAIDSGKNYSVESADGPLGMWKSVGTGVSASWGVQFTDQSATADPVRVYRVRALP